HTAAAGHTGGTAEGSADIENIEDIVTVGNIVLAAHSLFGVLPWALKLGGRILRRNSHRGYFVFRSWCKSLCLPSTRLEVLPLLACSDHNLCRKYCPWKLLYSKKDTCALRAQRQR